MKRERTDTERISWMQLHQRAVMPWDGGWCVSTASPGIMREQTSATLRAAIDAAMDAEEGQP